MDEEIKVDLYDDTKKDNKRFANLVDPARWEQLKLDFDKKPVEVLLEELLDKE